MEQLTLHFTGTGPILMHAPRTVNPLDPITQEIKKYTGKRKKTLEDHITIMRLEWEAGLYHDPELGPYLPGENVTTCLRDAAKLTKQGAAVERSVVCPVDKVPLLYDGPRGTYNRNGSEDERARAIQEIYDANLKDYRVVGNQKNSVMRCRPMFRPGGVWEIDVPLFVEPSVLDPGDLRDIAERAGKMIGLGDYRPRYGKFEVS